MKNERFIQKIIQIIDWSKHKKKDLKEMPAIGNSTMTKLANDENVTMEVITKICTALKCEMGDIVEIIPDSGEGK